MGTRTMGSREFTLDQYKEMARRFNKLSFTDKINGIIANNDILVLACDGNWWGVKVRDKDIQQQLEDESLEFNIEHEWFFNEMLSLLYIAGIKEVVDI